MIKFVLAVLLLAKAGNCFKHTIVTPKALRVGAQEKGILNLHGYAAATLSYFIQDLPAKQSILVQVDDVNLDNDACSQPIELDLQVPSDKIDKFRIRQTVLLTVQITNSGSDFTDTIEIYVSKDSGYIFLITDRPIYKPNDLVKIRAFPLEQAMVPSNQNVELIVKTPDGVGVEKKQRNLPDGDFIYHQFRIPENPVFGLWSVEGRYPDEGYETSTTINFAVQRYVLPTFKVKIETKPYILLSDNDISGTIKAEYSYGEKVTGSYFLSVKLKKNPDSKAIEIFRIPGQFEYEALFVNGEKTFQVPTNFIDLKLEGEETRESLFTAGASIIILATVTGSADGVLESALTPDIPLAKSPYVIDSTRLSKHYIPSLSYVVQVDIKDAIKGAHVQGVPVIITVGEGDNSDVYNEVSDPNGQINVLLDFKQAGNQRIEVTTNAVNLGDADQASDVFLIEPYTSSSKSYLQVTSTDLVVQSGRQIPFLFSFHPLPPPAEIRILILSRGSIVYSDVVTPEPLNKQATKRITATQNMIPSSRLVAYYLKGDEVVSASLFFEVVNQCKHELVVNGPAEVLPGKGIDLDIIGAPNSIVSLVGVDRAAYFLYDKSRLTRNTLFSKMGSFDQGCVQQGGKNGEDVFNGAGLIIGSNAIQPGEIRGIDCNQAAQKRKKRDVAEQNTDLEAELDKCERDGRLAAANKDDCLRRGERVRKFYDDIYKGCWERFYEGCMNETAERIIRTIRNIQGKSGGEVQAEQGVAETLIRTDFQESLFFTTVRLNNDGVGVKNATARHSITTFDIDAASMQTSPDGFCVAQPMQVRSFKKIFVHLYAPYSLKKREQANLRLTVFNYDQQNDHIVTLEVNPGPQLCSYYKSDEWSLVIVVRVRAGKSASQSITVLPLDIPDSGYAVMRVRVKAQGGAVLDSVSREILVEETGEIKDITGSAVIDLKHDRRTSFDLQFSFQERFVYGTRKCWIYAYSNFLGPTIEVDPISKEPRDIKSIFRNPGGCGEQTMLTTGPNVFALEYMVKSKKMAEGSAEYIANVNRIQAGFKNELAYRTTTVPSRPWAVFTHYPPSTWLNAYVDKVFAKGKLYYKAMDITPVCTSLEWLLTEQQADGHFREQRPPLHREMHGAVGGSLTLTAYVLITLQETGSLCLPALNLQIQNAATRAATYLQNNKDQAAFHRPYGVALLAYALALNQPFSALTTEITQRLLSMKTTSDDKKLVYWKARTAAEIAGTGIHAYWYTTRHSAVTVEATSYALLALVELAKLQHPVRQTDLDLNRKIAKWLIAQRNDGGAFKSTQDTVMGLQALANYQIWVDSVEPPNTDTDITLSLQGAVGTDWSPGSEFVQQLDNDNVNLKLQIDVPDNVMQSELVTVTATGVGEGVMSYRCIYRTEVDEESCAFDLSINIAEIKRNDNNPLMKIKITITIAKPIGDPAGMSIIEVGLLSGFVPIKETLNRLARDHVVDGMVDRYEITQQSVILYLNEITNEEESLVFQMEQQIPVAEPQPAKVNVYDYYEPQIRCGKFYALPGELTGLRTSCDTQNELCRCAEGGCPRCRTRDEQLKESICTGMDVEAPCASCMGDTCHDMYDTACKSKFALVVKVLVSFPKDPDGVFVEFTAQIVESLKKGTDVGVQKNSNRTFVARSDCVETCIDPLLEKAARSANKTANYFKEGNILFVVGDVQDKYRTKDHVWSEKYHLTERAVLERYIPDKKCRQNRNKYINFNCDDPAARNTPRCIKAGQFKAACDSMDEIKERLVHSCD